MVKIIQSEKFDSYWKNRTVQKDNEAVESAVRKIIDGVRTDDDAAVRRYAELFDKSSPKKLEVPLVKIKNAIEELRRNEPGLIAAMELAAKHIQRFSLRQRRQFSDFEYKMGKGLVTGQRVIPVTRAAVYVPAGRFPLFSSVLMGVIPAFCAGVEEVIVASPPEEDGLPNRKILAAAGIAKETIGPKIAPNAKLRIFAIGGAHAVAALALGTKSIPRVDVIAGPGNKYVTIAKRILFGEVGIDFIAGPTDVLIIADGSTKDIEQRADLIAADMIAQAEHDPDARARALIPGRELAKQITLALERRLAALPAANTATARASLKAGGLIIVYQNKEEAVRIANIIAPEHLELQIADAGWWIPRLKNYGSLFIGSLSAEALGDYSAGINHTLPTSSSARFTGGLSVRHFLKTVTTLRCAPGTGFEKSRRAAEILARAEGLAGHAESAAARGKGGCFSQ